MIKETYFVIGGCGHIGSYIVDHILENESNIRVVIIDNMYNGNINNNNYAYDHIIKNKDKNNELILEVASITLYNDLRDLFLKYKPRYVYHQASMLTLDSKKYRRKAVEVNVLGTTNIFDLCLEFDVEKIVYASSASVFGNPKYIPVDEKHIKECSLLYGATKIADEHIATSYSDEEGLKFVGLRYFNVYGPRQSTGNIYTQIVPKWINALYMNKPVTVYAGGNQTMDMIYGSDVGLINYKIMKTDIYRGKDDFDGFINIGSGLETTVNELLHMMMDTFKNKFKFQTTSEIIHDDHDPNLVKRRKCDISLMNRVLNNMELISVEEGLIKCIEHIIPRYKTVRNK